MYLINSNNQNHFFKNKNHINMWLNNNNTINNYSISPVYFTNYIVKHSFYTKIRENKDIKLQLNEKKYNFINLIDAELKFYELEFNIIENDTGNSSFKVDINNMIFLVGANNELDYSVVLRHYTKMDEISPYFN